MVGSAGFRRTRCPQDPSRPSADHVGRRVGVLLPSPQPLIVARLELDLQAKPAMGGWKRACGGDPHMEVTTVAQEHCLVRREGFRRDGRGVGRIDGQLQDG